MRKASHKQIPEAVLLLTSQCPHCPTVLQSLTNLIKKGELASLKVINLNQQPEAANIYDSQTVPWCLLGDFVLEGLYSESELQHWLDCSNSELGISEYCLMLLDQGKLAALQKHISNHPAWLRSILLLLENSDTPLSIRVGISALFESLDTALISAIIPPLAKLSQHSNAAIRSEACYFLSLSKDQSALSSLQLCLHDENAEVREIAEDGIQSLRSL